MKTMPRAELQDTDDHQRAQHPAHVGDPAEAIVALDIEGIAEIEPPA